MAIGPWRRELCRRLRGGPRRPMNTPRPTALRGPGRGIHPALLTLAVGLLVAACVVGLLESKLRPIVAEAAQAQVQNTITAVLEHSVAEDLDRRDVSYGDLVMIQRDEAGAITSLTTDMASMNLLRAELVSQVLVALDGIDVSEIRVPLGVLVDSELVWAKGPAICAWAMSVGTVSAEFESEFSSSGVNQTLHRIWLELSVPMTVFLPGGSVQVPVDTRLCVAETVIVGKVPDTYLQLGSLPASG